MEYNFTNFISENLESFQNNTENWLGNHAIEIVIILLSAWVVKRLGTALLSRFFMSAIRDDLYPTNEDRKRRIETINGISKIILRVLVNIVAVVMIINELGIDTAPLIASAGIIGVALGFGAQSLIKDLSSGLFIIIDNQYRVGDYVRLSYTSSSTLSGTVEVIGVRNTALRGLDGTLHHVPNGNILATSNLTMGIGGMYEEILVGHECDISKVADIIDQVGKSMQESPEFSDKIIEPPRFVRVDGMVLNGIKIKVFCSTNPNDSWVVKGEFYRRLIQEFHRADIEIPNNTRLTVSQSSKTKRYHKK